MKFFEIEVKSLVGPGSSSDQVNPMVQARVRLGVFELGAELTWDARQSASLEVKELGEQVTNGSRIFLASR